MARKRRRASTKVPPGVMLGLSAIALWLWWRNQPLLVDTSTGPIVPGYIPGATQQYPGAELAEVYL